MKNLVLIAVLFVSTLSNVCLADGNDDKKDWVLDTKTSTLIPNYVGKVKLVRGKVMVGENELAKGDKIYPKGLIKTGEKSFVVVDLIDETILTLGPDTEFTFEKWGFKTKSDREAIYSLLVGKMRAEIKVKTKEADQLIIKSPLVAMGIRGTDVLLNHSVVNGKPVSQVALIEGKVVVQNKGNAKKLNMIANDYVEVNSEKDIAEVEKKLTPDEVKKYNAVIAPGEKALLDYPMMPGSTMNKADDKGTEVAEVKESVINAAEGNPAEISKNKGPKPWKENLKKLNDLRKPKK